MWIRIVVLALLLSACSLSTAHAQNESVFGNLCVGLDCTSSETFGLDVLKLKDINVRIDFNDVSSSGGFPNNDWRITINSSLNGGPDFFAIDDSTNEIRPFLIEDRAQDDALVVSDQGGDGSAGGYIGIGTQNPLMEMHLFHGDSPGLRIEQDGTEGFGAYAWDVAGNEANFFVRDVTATGSGAEVIPFRIRAGTPSGTLTLDGANVGLGTVSPSTTLHLQSETPGLRVENSSTGTNALLLDENGNLTLSGVLTEASSALVKENRVDVDAGSVLQALRSIPIQTWNYTQDADAVRHMGPMAQDVYAAFGLGIGEEHLAPLDVNGIALASIQALADRLDAQSEENASLRDDVAALQEQNARLAERVARLEAAVQQMLSEKTTD
jgi:hypothetical protein